MKVSILSPILALLIAKTIALPAPTPTSVDVAASQDPSPPRPFPKYALDGRNSSVERDPLPSTSPTDRKSEAEDPSPAPVPSPTGQYVDVNYDSPPPVPSPAGPYVDDNYDLPPPVPSPAGPYVDDNYDLPPPVPSPAGQYVDVIYDSPPLAQRTPSAPHKLVEIITDSSTIPPPASAQDGEKSLEERDPLSRFPTDDEKEAADPSPPRPFPAGRLVEANGSSSNGTIEPRTPSPLLPITGGSTAEANDPSPPRPFPAGHPVEANTSSSSHTVEPHTPFRKLLGNTEGLKTVYNRPAPSRASPTSHADDIEPRGDNRLSPHRAHGGYFPPANPPAPAFSPYDPVPVPFTDNAAVKGKCLMIQGQLRCPSPVPEPTASDNTRAEIISDVMGKGRCVMVQGQLRCRSHVPESTVYDPLPKVLVANSATVPESTASDDYTEIFTADLEKRRCPVYVDCKGTRGHGTINWLSKATATARPTVTAAAHELTNGAVLPTRTPLPTPQSQPPRHHPNGRIPIATAFAPQTIPSTSSTTATASVSASTLSSISLKNLKSKTTTTTASVSASTLSSTFLSKLKSNTTTSSTTSSSSSSHSSSSTATGCTRTITSFVFPSSSASHAPRTTTSTIYNSTRTMTNRLNCFGCAALTITTMDVRQHGASPVTSRKARPTTTVTITDEGTTTEVLHVCRTASATASVLLV